MSNAEALRARIHYLEQVNEVPAASRLPRPGQQQQQQQQQTQQTRKRPAPAATPNATTTRTHQDEPPNKRSRNNDGTSQTRKQQHNAQARADEPSSQHANADNSSDNEDDDDNHVGLQGGEGSLFMRAAEARKQYARWILRRRTAACFLCEFEKYHYTQELAQGVESGTFSAATYGYGAMLRHYDEHSSDNPKKLATDLATIYTRHIYDFGKVIDTNPRLKGYYPKQTPENILIHLEEHNRDPEYFSEKAISVVKDVISVYSTEDAMLDPETGRPKESVGTLLLRCAGFLLKVGENKIRSQNARNGERGRTLSIDPNKVYSLASTRPLQAFQKQASDALGGATATNTDDVVTSISAQRPNMGGLVESSDAEGEEGEEGEEDEEDDDGDNNAGDDGNIDHMDVDHDADTLELEVHDEDEHEEQDVTAKHGEGGEGVDDEQRDGTDVIDQYLDPSRSPSFSSDATPTLARPTNTRTDIGSDIYDEF